MRTTPRYWLVGETVEGDRYVHTLGRARTWSVYRLFPAHYSLGRIPGFAGEAVKV
jgi:hypothetical protein